MNRFLRGLMSLCLVSLTAVSTVASAANYTLWINGRTGGGVVGNYDSWNYWGPGTIAAGINKKSVNWDGYNSIASQTARSAMPLIAFAPAPTGVTSRPTARAI